MTPTLEKALASLVLRQRSTYTHPTAHYQSVRRRNRGWSQRGAKKRARRVELQAVIQSEQHREHLWRCGIGTKPKWLHSGSTQYLLEMCHV